MAEFMAPDEAAEVLEKALAGFPKNATLTVADAAAKAGLALRDAERGLHHLSTKYRGTLSATEDGELLFRFPYGFSLPLTKRPWFQRAVQSVWRGVKGAAKFVVRAWVSIVLIGYAAVFLALALALAFSGRSDDRNGGGFGVVWVVLRVISEALWWTFHPFSPVARRNVYDGSFWQAEEEERPRPARSGPRTVRRTIRRFGQEVEIEETLPEEGVPFYEKVNRFVFGPEPAPTDPREIERRLLATIRQQKGRIGLVDVLRVTGLPREEADPLMARLLLDYEGEIDVSEEGAITWRFEKLRKTAGDVDVAGAVPPAWAEKAKAPPITGNDGGSNFLIGAVNAFNLMMSMVAISWNLTVDKIVWLLTEARERFPAPPPADGVAVALGVVPFVFSLLLFALPIGRALLHGRKERAAREENARKAVLKTVLEQTEATARSGAATGVNEAALKRAWAQETGSPPDDETLARAVAELGGDVDVDALAEGRGLYRFRDLEAEVKELQRQRAEASETEEKVGAVVFASDR